MCWSQGSFNLVNRGHVTIKPLSGREQIINLNSHSGRTSVVVSSGEELKNEVLFVPCSE